MPSDALETSLGYEFKQKELLELALTHRSHSGRHNERLEFLGDSILNCAVAYLLFERFNKIDEGDLSRLRANLVKQSSLADIAQRLEIARFLRLGEGELKSGGFRRPSILADTLEALFGAVMLDGGFDAARAVITRLYTPILETVDPKTLGKDAKTLLQEYLQGRKIALPIYTVVATHGAAHNQEFEVECAIPKLEIQVVGTGGSRRAAEQGAAKKALEAAMVSNPAPAKRVSRARKQAQLSLPVATIQSPDVDPGLREVSSAKHAKDSAKESVKDVSFKDAPSKEAVREASKVKEPSMKEAPGSKDPTSREVAAKDGASKDSATKDGITKDVAIKDAATKDAATKDAATKDAATKETATTSPKDAIGKDLVTKDAVVKDLSLKEVSPREAPSKEAKDGINKDGTAKETSTKEAASKDVAKQEAVPKETLTKDTSTKDTLPKDASSKDSIPKEGVGKEAVPKESTSKESAPKESASKDGALTDKEGKEATPPAPAKVSS